MSYRVFNPRRDALPVLQDGWLHPGERPTLADGFNSIRYAIDGRNRGAVPKRIPLPLITRPVLYPYKLFKGYFAHLLGAAPDEPFAFGSQSDCQAGQLADTDVDDHRAFWVLTDHRFASVTTEPMDADPGHEPSPSFPRRVAQISRELVLILFGGIHTLPVEPVRLRTVWELRASQYSYHGVVQRHRHACHRITLPDGSGIDFPLRP